MISENDEIKNLIQELRMAFPEKAGIVEDIRELFFFNGNSLTEEMKYGGIVFNNSGFLIGGIFPYSNHVSVEFSNGALFSDPGSILEGKGNKRRHIKIFNINNIQEKNVSFYISQAVKSVGQ